MVLIPTYGDSDAPPAGISNPCWTLNGTEARGLLLLVLIVTASGDIPEPRTRYLAQNNPAIMRYMVS